MTVAPSADLRRGALGTTSFLHQRGDEAQPRTVFIHGVFDSAECWEGVLGELPHGGHRYAVDVRGHGKTPLTRGTFEIPDIALEIISFIEQVPGEPVQLVGHSMGGILAQEIALRRPDLVTRLVLEDPAWEVPVETPSGLPIGLRERAHEISTWTDELILEQGRASHVRWDELEFQTWLQAKRDVDARFVDLKQNWQGATSINQLKYHHMPVLLLTAEESLGGLVTEEMTARARQRLTSNGIVLRIAGAGHDIRKDDRTAYVTALRAFLR